MRPLPALLAVASLSTLSVAAQQPFTLKQILSAPYSTQLTASPVGARFAWVEDAEGVHNLYIGGAQEPARALTHYTEDDAQDIASLAWSPDGKTIAYVYGAEIGNSGRPANPAHLQRSTALQIVLQPTDGTAPTTLGEGRAPLFSRDGNTLFFLRSGQIFTACVRNCQAAPAACPPESPACHPSRSGGSASVPRLPDSPNAAQPLLYDRGIPSALTLSPDGKTLAYISHRRTHNFLALFALETKTLTFPAPSTGNDAAPAFSRDGKYLAWLRYPYTDPSEFAQPRISPNPWSIQLLDLATKQARTLYQPEANKPGSVEPRLSSGEPRLMWAGGNRLLFFSEADGWVHLYSVNPGTNGTPSLLTPGEYEVEDASISPDGMTLAFSANSAESNRENACSRPPCKVERSSTDELDRDRRHLWEIHFGWQTPRAVAETGGTAIEVHPVFGQASLAALVSDASTPMHPAIIGLDGKIKPLGPVDAYSYPSTSLLAPQQVIFPSSDKLFQLHGQLFLPNQKAGSSAALRNDEGAAVKRPAILFFHGGPKRQMLLGYPAMDYYSNAYAMNQYLASRGYIVLSVNYRGGIGYGLDFRQCRHCGGDGAAEYADAQGAAAYLRLRPDVDAAHIGIWGGSYGGYFTALALARNSDIFAAGVDFHGVHEWAREDNAAGDWLRSETGNPAVVARIAEIAHASSPMADVDKWRSPVLFIHGDDDPDVAYIQTPLLADALRARKVHVEELIFPDELHGFVLHRDWLAAYEAAANFFDRTLKPASPPSK